MQHSQKDALTDVAQNLPTMAGGNNAPMTFQRGEEPDLGDMHRSVVAWQA